MSNLKRRLDRLDGISSGARWISLSLPEGFGLDGASDLGKRMAADLGYRGALVVIPFTHLGDTKPRIVGEGFELALNLLGELAEEGRRQRAVRNSHRAPQYQRVGDRPSQPIEQREGDPQ